MRVKDKVAIVTGGGGAIGREIAKLLATEGAKVVVADIVAEKGEETGTLIRGIGGHAIFVRVDVSNAVDILNMIETTIHNYGRLDILYNNAGIAKFQSIVDFTEETFNEIIGVNLKGTLLGMKYAIPEMTRTGGGSIINVASVGGLRCLPGRTAYCTTKAGLIMLTKQTALDYGKDNIRCNAVCPGGVTTEMTEADFGQAAKMVGMETGPFIKEIATAMPLNRFADIHEMGGICTFLASDDSSFMTGAELVIDGGTAVVDVVGAGISGLMRKAGVI